MITFAVYTHNEGESIETILSQLEAYCNKNDTLDEIIVIDDYSDDQTTLDILAKYEGYSRVKVFKHALDNDFAAHKNYASEVASGDFIFQIDADEELNPHLLNNISELLELNPEVDCIFVPRVNTVEGATTEDIHQFKWIVNDRGWINFPDYQSRIYRKSKSTIWTGKVHERVIGTEDNWAYALLPADERWSIKHHKHIDRQRKQNKFYERLQ